MRNTFVKTLLRLAREDPHIILVTGDLGFGVLDSFWQELPDQFINVGIAEQNMTGVATGLALEGRIVFTYSIGNFPALRCLEQVRNDAAYHRANLKIVSIGAGFAYGVSGMSHHATEDMAILRALPDVTVFSPGDPWEAEVLTEHIYITPGTCYLRLGKGGEKTVHTGTQKFSVGQALPIITSGDVAVFATGTILDNCYNAVKQSNKCGVESRLYSFPTISPLDSDLIREVACETRMIITVEEHNLAGGFGSAVAEIMAELPSSRAYLKRLGIPNCYVSFAGTQEYLRKLYGLSTEGIYQAIVTP